MSSVAAEPNTSEESVVGRVLTPVLIENLGDLLLAERGYLAPDQVRRVALPDAQADTGSTYLSLPSSMIKQLGLSFLQERAGRTAAGPRLMKLYSNVRLTIQGRACPLDVAEVPDGTPVLVGQLPLENLDCVPLPREGKLVPNPAHGGEWVIEMY